MCEFAERWSRQVYGVVRLPSCQLSRFAVWEGKRCDVAGTATRKRPARTRQRRETRDTPLPRDKKEKANVVVSIWNAMPAACQIPYHRPGSTDEEIWRYRRRLLRAGVLGQTSTSAEVPFGTITITAVSEINCYLELYNKWNTSIHSQEFIRIAIDTLLIFTTLYDPSIKTNNTKPFVWYSSPIFSTLASYFLNINTVLYSIFITRIIPSTIKFTILNEAYRASYFFKNSSNLPGATATPKNHAPR